jgi:site-specific recombinase XerD
MLDHFFSCRSVLSRMRSVPFDGYLCSLAEHLREKGYRREVGQDYLRTAFRFLSWLETQGIAPSKVEEKDVEVFFRTPMTSIYGEHPMVISASASAHAATRHLVRIIRREHPATSPSLPETPVEASLSVFREYLQRRCGYADGTVKDRLAFTREFLTRFFGGGPLDVVHLNPTQIMAHVSEHARLQKRESTSHLATALRSYFRFLQFQGVPVTHLLSAVPRIVRRQRFSAKPVLTGEQIRALLNGFDVAKAKDQRDQAMALCMLDLGMRSCDVAALVLEDLDWREGVIRIPNIKTRHPYPLPLPARVGRAIARYLRHGRPHTELREVFLRHHTPVKKLEPRSVQSAMHTAYVRAGLPETWHGCHILRRTAATRMHRQGVPLKEIADVLGHQSIDTTLLYTRLDPVELAKVALPWPEERA